jgi:hypothetical protein
VSDYTRRMYDRTAADWRTASDAAGMAGATVVAIPVTQMSVLLFGYEQLKAERQAAIALINGTFEDRGIHPLVSADLLHALGALDRDQLGDTYREHGATLPEEEAEPETQMWEIAVQVPRGEAGDVCRAVELVAGAAVCRAWPAVSEGTK